MDHHQQKEMLWENHLDSPEGRLEFLTEKLTPYVARADLLNQEIVALSTEVAEKMDEMNQMLPTLNMSLRINDDLLQIDAILAEGIQTDEQQEIVNRLAEICKTVSQL